MIPHSPWNRARVRLRLRVIRFALQIQILFHCLMPLLAEAVYNCQFARVEQKIHVEEYHEFFINCG
jgi:hypothetical protein